MQKIIHNLKWLTLSIAMGIVLGGGLITIKAWTEPTVAPPGGNLGAPINTSANGQIKSGALQVNGFRNLGTTILDGNVGIGMTSPSTKLQVLGSSIRVGNNSAATDIYSGGVITRNFDTGNDSARNDHADSYSFYVRGGYAMNIYNDRNVGIGNASMSPNLKLDVEGKVGATEYCDNNGNNCKAITAMGGTPVSGGLYGYCAELQCEGTDCAEYMFSCYDSKSPAYCTTGGTTRCACQSGYALLAIARNGSIVSFVCYKN